MENKMERGKEKRERYREKGESTVYCLLVLYNGKAIYIKAMMREKVSK